MAIIRPQGTIKLYTKVPLIPDGEDTLDFDTPAEQKAYFDLYTFRTLTEYSYIRGGADNGGTIRVNLRAEDCYFCNYLAYQNEGFSDKWFYAFVRRVSYVSPTVCEIEFTIDEWQTWLFNWDFGDCQIERETVTQKQENDLSVLRYPDTPPHVTQTDCKINNFFGDDLAQYGIRVVTSDVSASLYWSQSANYAMDRGGTSEVSVNWYDLSEAGALEAYKAISEKTSDQLLSVTIAPRALSGGIMGRRTVAPVFATDSTGDVFLGDTFADNYTPRNAKTRRAIDFVVRSTAGENIYNLLDFGDGVARFAYFGDALGVNCGVTIEPLGYLSPQQTNISGLPLVGRRAGAWSITYNTDVATRSDSYANGQTLKTMLSPLFSLVGSLDNLGKWAVSSAVGVAQSLVMSADQRYTVNSAGSSPATDTRFSLDQPVYCWRSCSATDARKIDIYYSAYGYKVDRFGKPSKNNRVNWDYLKLTTVQLYSIACPSDAIARISERLRNGLRIWHNADIFGSVTDSDGNPRANSAISEEVME